jgi:hypothetical protein
MPQVDAGVGLYGTTQLHPKLALTGIEYYTGTNTNGDGVGLLLGVNRTNNRQLWICDTAQTAINTTNTVLRIVVGTPTVGIDAVATDGLTRKSLSIGGDAIVIDTSSYPALRRILKFSGVLTSDDVAFMNGLIFNQGAFAGGVFAGDNFISAYWGVSILLNSGGNSIPNGSLVCIQTTNMVDPGFPWHIKQTTESLDKLINKFNFTKLIYSGEKRMPYKESGFNRYMIIGKKK